MIIQHNMNAINASRQLGLVRGGLAKSAEKLSSGYRINRAADDAAGLSISEKMRRQVRGLNQGIANTEDGVSLCQVADGALGEVHDMIQRLEELSVKAANGTNSGSDRQMIQDEIDGLLTEINRISDTTKFNEHIIFGGSDVEKITASLTLSTQPTTPTTPTPTPPAVGGTVTVCGDFTVQGGTLGTDFEFDSTNGMLRILTATPVRISGTTNQHCIKVAGNVNANVILKDVNIDASQQRFRPAFCIAYNSTGNVNIFLEGTNTLKSGEECAGLQKEGDHSMIGKLTISGTGSLMAVGGGGGAGIGGGKDESSRNIAIESGKVTAIGSKGRASNIAGGAGIGGGASFSHISDGTYITISGGEVTAIGSDQGAGIGGGGHLGGGHSGNGSYITITGGKVTAIGGYEGAGIGGGRSGEGSYITISGGEVTATGGEKGAGIGSGYFYSGSSYITITGGEVTATGVGGGAGIGGGYFYSRNNYTTISGGKGSAMCDTGAQKIGTGSRSVDGTDNTVGGNPAPADATDRNGGTFTWNLSDAGIPVPPADPTPLQTPTVELIVKSSNSLWIQSGHEAGDGIFMRIDAMNTATLRLDGMNVATAKGADNAMKAVDFALAYVSALRSKIGAYQNRLEHTIANEGNIVENTTSAESGIRDTDMAKEMVRHSNLNILAQAGQSMLVQANQSRQGVLSLVA